MAVQAPAQKPHSSRTLEEDHYEASAPLLCAASSVKQVVKWADPRNDVFNLKQTLTSRSMYPYNAPGAFVPHSAINLSVKPGGETGQPGTSALTSLDLSMTDGSGASSYLNQVS